MRLSDPPTDGPSQSGVWEAIIGIAYVGIQYTYVYLPSPAWIAYVGIQYTCLSPPLRSPA